VSLGIVVTLAIPALSMRLGFPDDSGTPPGSISRIAYDLTAEGFGPGANGPFFVAVQLPKTGDVEGLAQIVSALEATSGVAQVIPNTAMLPLYTESLADNQIMALVRTSINQVANAASMAVYEANQDITKKYQYVAALDTRTSAICRALDGREFEYGKGPMPPQHFNCRSKVVAVIDYENLGFTPPPEGTRASKDGQVDANINYGQWLKDQPRSVQEEVLGKDKVVYFNKLAEKHGARDAMAKLVRDDGSELSLDDLRKRYGAQKS
jgi:SPP1 gp7 family putative phage head morphogenesis protein